MKPRALILRTAGTNCDRETAFAFDLAGAAAQTLHVNRLIESPDLLSEFQILAVPGGFSYGDDIAAGRILALQIMHRLAEPMRDFVSAGKPVIGICNGFQALVKTDLLPGWPGGRAGMLCTLTHNDCGRFVDRWIRLMPRSKKCIWTMDLPPLDLPVAHGEGKFVPADEQARSALWKNQQVVFTYARADDSPALGEFPHNPNGSVDDIAGICDASGLVLGLMPHPERAVLPYSPRFFHFSPENPEAVPEPPAITIFRNAVAHVTSGVGAGV